MSEKPKGMYIPDKIDTLGQAYKIVDSDGNEVDYAGVSIVGNPDLQVGNLKVNPSGTDSFTEAKPYRPRRRPRRHGRPHHHKSRHPRYRSPKTRTDPSRSPAIPRVSRKDCSYCHQRPAITVEHFLPFSSGLELAHQGINKIPVCRECNERKGGRWPGKMEADLFFEYWQQQLRAVEDVLRTADAIQRDSRGNLPASGYQRSRRRRR